MYFNFSSHDHCDMTSDTGSDGWLNKIQNTKKILLSWLRFFVWEVLLTITC